MKLIDGRYESLGILGEGATGVVYDAIRLEDRTAVALKVMHATLANDAQIRGRFTREAAILGRMRGDHLCPIVDFGEVSGDESERGALYIALAKVDGPSLATVLEQGLLDVPRALEIMLDVLAGLGEAHAQGVVHRDLKPANVLLTASGRAIVVDFGLSKIIVGGGTGTTGLTSHGMVFGTPEYMAPEQARGDETDPRCDIYAAGVMLYELLTGTRPFTGPTPLAVLTAHLGETLEPPSKRPGGKGRVTRTLDKIVLRALARDAADRYESAEAFGKALAKAAAEGERLPLDGATPEEGPPSSVNAAGPTLLSGPTLPPPARERTKERVTTSPPQTRRQRHRAVSLPWVLLWLLVASLSIAAGIYFALRG
jgi:serine/threonine protein kinase